MSATDKKPIQFYFSLPRLAVMVLGGDARRSERNGFEAGLIGLLVFGIHYLFFAVRLLHSNLAGWLTPLLLIPLAFAVWIFWLLLFYVDTFVIKLLRSFGLFQNAPDRHAQAVIWAVITTVMAGDVLRAHPWFWQLALIWLFAVTLNLIAALVLAFSDVPRSFEE